MFRSSRPTFFGDRSRRRGPPAWLLWLLGGLIAGAAGVIVVQQRYLPPRLSIQDSAALRADFEQADGERARLRGALQQAQAQLQDVRSRQAELEGTLARHRGETERLRADLEAVVQALPPDPRGGDVEVRAGQFSVRDGVLDYQLVLLRDAGNGRERKPLTGTLQLTVSGESARGAPASVALQPIALSLRGHDVLRGSLPLPEGFKPRQTTVQVLDRAAGRPLGMRVILVR